MERQVTESLNIIKASKTPEECLNLKTEWGGSKLPAIEVSRPKGTSGPKKIDDSIDREGNQEDQGSKRIRTKEGEEVKMEKEQEDKARPGKKRREASPEENKIRWRLRPTFLDLKGKDKEEKEDEVNEQEGREVKEGNKPSPEKEKEKIRDPEPETRTPVKERVRRINKKAEASPGKFPNMKQQMLELYFKKKSPKADKAREKTGPKPEENKEQVFMGASNSPLLGEPHKVGSPEPTSWDPKLEPVECGKAWRKGVKKKALKALERWPPDTGTKLESPKRGKPRKRLQGPALGKDKQKEGTSKVLLSWLQKERKGSEAHNTSLGPEDRLTVGCSDK